MKKYSSYEKQYRAEIGTEDYRISIEEFMEWMSDNFTKRVIFYSELKRLIDNPEDEWRLFDIAVDFSIPVVMVKWFVRLHQ